MPYIKQERRDVFEHSLQEIIHELNEDQNLAKGELNYIIFSLVKRYIEKNGLRYAIAQDFIGGVLTCCQMELYRKVLAPYENEAIEKNGDV